MKNIAIPSYMLKLEYPWNLTSSNDLRTELEVLAVDRKTIENALAILDYSFAFLSQNTDLEEGSIPEDMRRYWTITVESISLSIPTFSDFDLLKIEEDLRLSNISSPPEKMIEETAQLWIWTVIRRLIATITLWLEQITETGNNDKVVDEYLKIASRYWQSSIPEDMRMRLVSNCFRIGKEKAISSNKEIEEKSVDKDLIDLARDRKILILENLNYE